MSTSRATGEVFLVIGGTGFLGRNLTSALVNRGETKVHVVDVRPPSDDLRLDGVSYHTSDITDLARLTQTLAQIKPRAVFHTASPHPGSPHAVMEKVNVTGTANVVEACKSTGVRKLVFTSSGSVVFSGEDFIYGDERIPYPDKIFDVYSETKARAEKMVLDANTPDTPEHKVPQTGLRTASIRPAGIFGPNDGQALPGFFKQLLVGRTNVQLGENSNLFDWTYVDNVSHAHILASDKLETPGYSVALLSSVHLPPVTGTDERAWDRGVPTSESRPDVKGAVDYAKALPSTLSATSREETLNVRPVVRGKYDQFFHLVHPDVASPGSPLPEVPLTAEYVPIAGEAFFVTNGHPMPFWDLPRALWSQASTKYAADAAAGKRPWKLSKDFALFLGGLADTFGRVTGKQMEFTKFKITFTCTTRYYNIERARRVLGYEPLVGMKEAIRRSVEWWLSTPDGKAFKAKEVGQ
ncbi:unnamed protein product [Parajaminaea phylloscopi]